MGWSQLSFDRVLNEFLTSSVRSSLNLFICRFQAVSILDEAPSAWYKPWAFSVWKILPITIKPDAAQRMYSVCFDGYCWDQTHQNIQWLLVISTNPVIQDAASKGSTYSRISPLSYCAEMCVGGAAEPAHGGRLHLTLHTKHTVSGRKFARLCVSAGYVWSADCASTASCRREQISQLLKRCPKLSWPPTRVPSHACALFHSAPRGFAVSATLFQTRTWDLFWGPSRLATEAKAEGSWRFSTKVLLPLVHTSICSMSADCVKGCCWNRRPDWPFYRSSWMSREAHMNHL